MDDDTHALIIQLCTRMGMIMEDASDIALRIGRVERGKIDGQLEKIGEAATHIGQLIDTCLALRSK